MDARELIFKAAEYIADHAETNSRFLYPERLRCRRVEVVGLVTFLCEQAGVGIEEVNAHLDRVGK